MERLMDNKNYIYGKIRKQILYDCHVEHHLNFFKVISNQTTNKLVSDTVSKLGNRRIINSLIEKLIKYGI